MAKKHGTWPKVSEALDAATDRITTVPGVVSVHGQHSNELAIVVVLVDSKRARQAVRHVEDELFREDPEIPLDISVYPVAEDKIEPTKEALSTGYSLLWSRN